MINRIQFKVCGLKTLADARSSEQVGADFLGFNFYEKSPRYISLEDYGKIADKLPKISRVAVSVNSDLDTLKRFEEAGLDFFQIHFKQDEDGVARAKAWSETVGPDRLWLAPKIAPHESFDLELLQFADTIQWDAFKEDAYGGTGKVSDWESFGKLKQQYPETRWVLAGGLGPENLKEAFESTGALVFDFNSKVELAPGQKDPKALQAVKEGLGLLQISSK